MNLVGIIGLGTITKYYLKGIQGARFLRLDAVCDVDPNAPSRGFFQEVPFFTDYREMIDQRDLGYVVISTPPSSHFEIASFALEHGVNVIIEKPATLNMRDYHALLELAKQRNLVFEVSFHWQNGSEVQKFNQLYQPEKISEISVSVQDPYSADGVVIDPQKRKLMGAWIDSGVNILSLIKMWLPMESVQIENARRQLCPESGLPIYADVRLVMDGVKIHITVDWRNGQNRKESFVVYDGRTIHLNHSGQCIVDGEDTVDCVFMERLQQHYYHYFRNFSGNADVPSAQRIHEILFQVNDAL